MLRLYPAAAVLAAASLPGAALAAATVESAVGDVRLIAAGSQKPALVKTPGVRIASGSTVVTGVDGMAVLRFDDEQKLMLAPNSQLAILDYHYRANAASADRAELMLHRGAARVVTGLIPHRNVEMFVFRTPHVNLGVRGTDFTATIIGQSYWSVNEGSVLASTNVGRGVFGKGAYGRSSALDRLAACWYSGVTWSMDVAITDGQTHRVALYFLDWDNAGRRQVVQPAVQLLHRVAREHVQQVQLLVVMGAGPVWQVGKGYLGREGGGGV